MNVEIINKLKKTVEDTCKKETNVYGYDAWTYHINPVVRLSEKLAKAINADVEIVIVAAILHDYASVLDDKLYEEHHIHGMKLAEEILTNLNYDKTKIEKVKKCIFSHRGSKNIERLSKEEICLASADAMAHIDQIPSLFSLALKVKKLSVDESSKFILGKINRSYNKLCDEAKEIIQDKYDAALILLGEYE